MPQVMRVLVYDFENEDDLDAQLGKSLPDGLKKLPQGTIFAATVPDVVRRAVSKWLVEAEKAE